MKITNQFSIFIRSSTSGGLFRLNRNLIVAALFVAVTDQPFLLRGFFKQERRATLRASLGHRLVPDDEVAVRIFQTPVEHLAALRTPFDQLTAAAGLGTGDADSLRLDVLALRIVSARNKFAKPAFSKHEFCLAALWACFVQQNVGLLGSLSAGCNFPCRFALGITGTCEELAESPALQRHGLAAVLARFGLGRFA